MQNNLVDLKKNFQHYKVTKRMQILFDLTHFTVKIM